MRYRSLTIAAASLWSVEWFVGDTSVRTYTYAANPTINYLQLGGNRDATAMGTFDNFSLSCVPEPSTWMILLFGIFSLAAWWGGWFWSAKWPDITHMPNVTVRRIMPTSRHRPGSFTHFR